MADLYLVVSELSCGRLDFRDFVGRSVASNDEPRLAAVAVIPIFAVPTGGIFTQINVFEETIQGVRTFWTWSFPRGVAQICKLS